MLPTSHFGLIDGSATRGAGLSYLLGRKGIVVESFTDASAFLQSGAQCDLVFVHDDDELIRPLLDGMARNDSWYPHVVYSEEPDWRRAVEAMSSGAKTYVAFPDQVDEVPTVLSALGQNPRPSDERGKGSKARSILARLTRREIDVLKGVLEGDTSREIAQTLGISARTVEIHRANLLKKTGAKNGVDLVRIAMQAGIQDSEDFASS